MKGTRHLVAAGLAVCALLIPQTAVGALTAVDLANMLSGVFVGSTPNNHLKLDIQTINVDPLHQFDLFLSVSGQFETTPVRQQGLIRLQTEGNGVYFGYVPHFDPTVTALSAGAGRFTETEADAACGFMLKEKGDGFSGETLGSSCARAMRGAIQKWIVEVEPGTIRLQDPQTGETLRFTKLTKEKTEKPEKSSKADR